MKHKTAELTGALLDQAVAKAESFTLERELDDDGTALNDFRLIYLNGEPTVVGPSADEFISKELRYSPSTNWSQGGLIIERERITVQTWPDDWAALWYGQHGTAIGAIARGTTPLIAAMRAYVASKLGDEVDL